MDTETLFYTDATAFISCSTPTFFKISLAMVSYSMISTNCPSYDHVLPSLRLYGFFRLILSHSKNMPFHCVEIPDLCCVCDTVL